MAAKKTAVSNDAEATAKPAKAKKSKKLEAEAPPPAPTAAPRAPTHEQIAARASELYAAGGRDHVGNWLAAERELTVALKG